MKQRKRNLSAAENRRKSKILLLNKSASNCAPIHSYFKNTTTNESLNLCSSSSNILCEGNSEITCSTPASDEEQSNEEERGDDTSQFSLPHSSRSEISEQVSTIYAIFHFSEIFLSNSN